MLLAPVPNSASNLILPCNWAAPLLSVSLPGIFLCVRILVTVLSFLVFGLIFFEQIFYLELSVIKFNCSFQHGGGADYFHMKLMGKYV